MEILSESIAHTDAVIRTGDDDSRTVKQDHGNGREMEERVRMLPALKSPPYRIRPVQDEPRR